MKGEIKELDGFRIERIPHSETYPFLLKRHYARRIPSITWSFGLFKDREILGVLTIGKPASPSLCDGICGKEYSSQVYELNRVFLEDGLPKNTASFFISRCLGYIRPSPSPFGDCGFIIVSYADTDKSHFGYIYQATNWIYTGITKERTDIGSEDGTHSRHYDKTIDKKLNRKRRSSKHRYVMFIGNKRFKKKMMGLLKYPVCEYPKGNTEHFDTGSCQTQTVMELS